MKRRRKSSRLNDRANTTLTQYANGNWTFICSSYAFLYFCQNDKARCQNEKVAINAIDDETQAYTVISFTHTPIRNAYGMLSYESPMDSLIHA